GHAWEMATQSLTNMHFAVDALPFLPNARRYAQLGCIPSGSYRNEMYLTSHIHMSEQVDSNTQAILWDPQTSGGLFAAIDPAIWPQLAALAPDVMFWRIGEVTELVPDEAHVQLEVD